MPTGLRKPEAKVVWPEPSARKRWMVARGAGSSWVLLRLPTPMKNCEPSRMHQPVGEDSGAEAWRQAQVGTGRPRHVERLVRHAGRRVRRRHVGRGDLDALAGRLVLRPGGEGEDKRQREQS